MENIVAKGEIACFEQFHLLSLCFQKAVCCRGVRKHLYQVKGKALLHYVLCNASFALACYMQTNTFNMWFRISIIIILYKLIKIIWGCEFESWLGQLSFRRLTKVIATCVICFPPMG